MSKWINTEDNTGRWHGESPECCDVCQKTITDTFIDGKTQMGPWGNMCPKCFVRFGIGLGTGKGQRYKLVKE